MQLNGPGEKKKKTTYLGGGENRYSKHGEDYIIGIHYTTLLEKAMAPHSSTLVWKIPWMEEPGRLQSMGLLGVGHD